MLRKVSEGNTCRNPNPKQADGCAWCSVSARKWSPRMQYRHIGRCVVMRLSHPTNSFCSLSNPLPLSQRKPPMLPTRHLVTKPKPHKLSQHAWAQAFPFPRVALEGIRGDGEEARGREHPQWSLRPTANGSRAGGPQAAQRTQRRHRMCKATTLPASAPGVTACLLPAPSSAPPPLFSSSAALSPASRLSVWAWPLVAGESVSRESKAA